MSDARDNTVISLDHSTASSICHLWPGPDYRTALGARALGTEILRGKKIFYFVLKISFKIFVVVFLV